MTARLPVLPPHPAVYLKTRDELTSYLRTRGFQNFVREGYISISLDLGGPVDNEIDAHLLDDQVRFVTVTPFEIPDSKLALVALAVERINEQLGFPVWRVLPVLSATYTVTLDHTGALSSRAVEYAIALLSDALVRDMPALGKLLGK